MLIFTYYIFSSVENLYWVRFGYDFSFCIFFMLELGSKILFSIFVDYDDHSSRLAMKLSLILTTSSNILEAPSLFSSQSSSA